MLTPLFQQHRWAMLTLIDFCIGLTNEQLAASLPGHYGSISDTWGHLTEEGFLAAAEGGLLARPQPEVAPTLPEIRERLDRSGARAIEMATWSTTGTGVPAGRASRALNGTASSWPARLA